MEFFNPHLYDLANPELWVAAGLFLFLGLCVFVGVPKLIAGQLDAKAAKIQSELDEAARLRAEAEALLAQIRASNPDILHARSDERGFTLLEVKPEAIQVEFMTTPHPAKTDSVFKVQAQAVIRSGVAGLQKG